MEDQANVKSNADVCANRHYRLLVIAVERRPLYRRGDLTEKLDNLVGWPLQASDSRFDSGLPLAHAC